MQESPTGSVTSAEPLGPFPPGAMMEDFEFVRTARRVAVATGRDIVTLPVPALCSGRRWEHHGTFTVTLVNQLIVWGYTSLEATPEQVYQWYYGSIPGPEANGVTIEPASRLGEAAAVLEESGLAWEQGTADTGGYVGARGQGIGSGGEASPEKVSKWSLDHVVVLGVTSEGAARVMGPGWAPTSTDPDGEGSSGSGGDGKRAADSGTGQDLPGGKKAISDEWTREEVSSNAAGRKETSRSDGDSGVAEQWVGAAGVMLPWVIPMRAGM